ncbi:hypothetical protein [Gimesia sp.]|uniref:hypothetical protein n=1 Tax=Gimesia sp. TaxID=2024833 RepID=UPI0032ED80A1
MAIEFDCPYCTSTLKVPDTSAGKQGDCPRCGTKLVIPNPFAMSEQVPPTPQETQAVSQAQAPAMEAPAGASQETVPPPGDSVAVQQRPLSSATAQYLRKRRRSNVGPILLIILCFGLMLGAAGYFYYTYGPHLEGNLVGARLSPEDASLEQLQKTSDLGLSADVIQAVNNSFKETPRRVQSDLMEMTFFGPEQGGLKVRLKPGAKTEIVRVDLTGDPALLEYIKQHGTQLDQPRYTELQSQLAAFYTDWNRFLQEGGPMPDLINYRNTIGLNSLMGGLGYHMEARVNNRVFPCVHDDYDGGLYFLVPKGTLQFEILGSKMENGWTKFPGKYTVQVTQEYQGH